MTDKEFNRLLSRCKYIEGTEYTEEFPYLDIELKAPWELLEELDVSIDNKPQNLEDAFAILEVSINMATGENVGARICPNPKLADNNYFWDDLLFSDEEMKILVSPLKNLIKEITEEYSEEIEAFNARMEEEEEKEEEEIPVFHSIWNRPTPMEFRCEMTRRERLLSECEYSTEFMGEFPFLEIDIIAPWELLREEYQSQKPEDVNEAYALLEANVNLADLTDIYFRICPNPDMYNNDFDWDEEIFDDLTYKEKAILLMTAFDAIESFTEDDYYKEEIKAYKERLKEK